MKTKSITGCQREKNGLRVSQTSMISKNSLTQVRISQQADLETCTQSKQDVSFCSKVYPEDVGRDEANCHGLLDGENFQIQRQPSLSNDMETDLRIILGTALAPCVSNLETIFSPTLQSIDDHNEPNVLSAGGNEEDCEVSSPRLDDCDENDRSSCEYQTCNVSDFYISDMIFSELPIKGHCVYDFNETAPFPDYKCDEPSTCLDEEVMILPFLEDTLESSNAHDSRLCEDSIINSVDSSFYVSLHQLKSYNQESDVNTYQVSDQAECLDLDFFIRTLTDVSDVATNPCPTNVKPEGTRKKKSTTLVLDLDETLVHSTLDHCDDADFTFPVFVNMKEHTVYVKQRPYLHTFLERVADMFEIVVFTASQSIYAKQLLDILDPDQKIFSHRAYRESCIFADGSYTKDLTVLGVDLAKIAIIDNSPQVFRLQVNNGIPIKSWFDDPSDSALISLLPFLETLVDAEDVRPIIAKKFGNKE